MPSPPMKPGTLRLSDVARHVVVPDGIVSTGWPSVRDKCLDLGVRFDPWQEGLGRAVLGKRADGKYAATVGGVVLSIPRQVGKTFTVGTILFALCILFPGLTVLWTAHRLKTAAETFAVFQGMAKRVRIAPFVEAVFVGSGDEEVRFRNGSRILFGARERGFGRGFAMVDVEVFDEAQILTDRALDDMVPAANQSKHRHGALLFFMGTPPKPTDPGEAFTNKRSRALSGKSTDTVYVEFSADADADPDDRKQWAKANPSFPVRTPLEAMLRMRENLLNDESFMREALGVWDDDGAVSLHAAWPGLLDVSSRVDGVPRFGLDVSPNAKSAAIGVAGVRADGLMHVELTGRDGVLDHHHGTDWVVPRAVDLASRNSNFVLSLIAGSAAEALVPQLAAAGVVVELVKAADLPAACGLLFNLGTSEPSGLRHIGQPDITNALAGAVKVDVGDSAWKWARRKSTSDITPLYAVTAALWAANHAKPTPNVW